MKNIISIVTLLLFVNLSVNAQDINQCCKPTKTETMDKKNCSDKQMKNCKINKKACAKNNKTCSSVDMKTCKMDNNTCSLNKTTSTEVEKKRYKR